jgi:hypothetical protein
MEANSSRAPGPAQPRVPVWGEWQAFPTVEPEQVGVPILVGVLEGSPGLLGGRQEASASWPCTGEPSHPWSVQAIGIDLTDRGYARESRLYDVPATGCRRTVALTLKVPAGPIDDDGRADAPGRRTGFATRGQSLLSAIAVEDLGTVGPADWGGALARVAGALSGSRPRSSFASLRLSAATLVPMSTHQCIGTPAPPILPPCLWNAWLTLTRPWSTARRQGVRSTATPAYFVEAQRSLDWTQH